MLTHRTLITHHFLKDVVCFLSLQVAHMTRSKLYLSDTAFIGPCLLFLNQYFNSFIDEYIVLWIALVRKRNTAWLWQIYFKPIKQERFSKSFWRTTCQPKGNLPIWHFAFFLKQVLSVVDLTRYCTGVCLQIAAHLHIRVFSITPQGHDHKDWQFARREEEVGPSEDIAPLLEPQQENQTLSSLDSVDIIN